MTEVERAELILRFLEIAGNGTVKPNNPAQVARSLKSELGDDFRIEHYLNSYVGSPDVRDAKDYKYLIYAASEELMRILKVGN